MFHLLQIDEPTDYDDDLNKLITVNLTDQEKLWGIFDNASIPPFVVIHNRIIPLKPLKIERPMNAVLDLEEVTGQIKKKSASYC